VLSAAGGPPARFHWRPVLSSRPPDLQRWLAVCRSAEDCGVESVVVALEATAPDPFAWAAALGRRTATVAFLIVLRAGVSSPTYAVQQVNTLAAVTGGRVRVGVSAVRPAGEHRGYGELADPEAHARRTEEFATICHRLWEANGPVDFAGRHYRIEGARLTTPWVGAGRSRPEVYLFTGAAPVDPALARPADCVLATGSPGQVLVRTAVAAGPALGLSLDLRGWASDPGWLTGEVAAYQAAGVGQFVLAGTPEQLTAFGREVLPRIRASGPAIAPVAPVAAVAAVAPKKIEGA
jgi:alkanesulfonate monooxygenase